MKQENISIEEKIHRWQPLIELIVVLATIVGTTVPLYIHTDNTTKEMISEIRRDMQVQNARSDRLYEMFVELLKEGK